MPNILAYFDTPEQAQAVARKLREAGIGEFGIDRIHRFQQEYDFEQNGPFPTRLTGGGERSEAVLLNSDPSFGGLSSPGLAGRKNILLTVVLEDNQLEKAREIIKQGGGLI